MSNHGGYYQGTPGHGQQGYGPSGHFAQPPAPKQTNTWLILVCALVVGIGCGAGIFYLLGRSDDTTVAASQDDAPQALAAPDPTSTGPLFEPLATSTPTAIPTTVVAETPDAPTPEPTAAPATTPNPTAPNPAPTTAPTVPPAATPVPEPEPDERIVPAEYRCSISASRIGVGETTTYQGTHLPLEASVTYAFDHGDGTIDGRNPSFAAYDTPGNYEVMMIATADATGRQQTLVCGTVEVIGAAPAVFRCVVDPLTVDIGELVTYRTVDRDGNPVASRFFPGDGIDPVDLTPELRYLDRFFDAGTYVARAYPANNPSAIIDCPAVTALAPEAPVLPSPITVGCVISNAGQDRILEIQVGEAFQIRGIVSGNDNPVAFRFSHGDGTLDQRQLEVSDAFYETPGTYTVTAEWRFTGGTDPWKQLLCGQVIASG